MQYFEYFDITKHFEYFEKLNIINIFCFAYGKELVTNQSLKMSSTKTMETMLLSLHIMLTF